MIGPVLGYVDSGHASGGWTPAENGSIDDSAQIGLPWGVNAWYGLYNSTQIDGIFYDRGPEFTANGPTDNWFNRWYTRLASDTRANSAAGAKIMLNASGYPYEWVMSVADYATTWENSSSNYSSVYTYKAIGPGGNLCNGTNCEAVPGWWSYASYTSVGRIAHVVYGGTQYDVDPLVSTSRNRGSPSFYLIDRSTSDYSGLACYFEEEVAAVFNNQPSNGQGKTMCPSVGPSFTPGCTDLNHDKWNCGACGYYCGNGQCSGDPTNGYPPCICDPGYHWCDVASKACFSDSLGRNWCP